MNTRWQWARENTDFLSRSILEIQLERGDLIEARWDDHYRSDPAQPKFEPDEDSIPVCAEVEQLLGIEPIYREDIKGDQTLLRMKKLRRVLEYHRKLKLLFGYLPDYNEPIDKIAQKMKDFNDYYCGNDRVRRIVSIITGRYNGILERNDIERMIREYPFINNYVFDNEYVMTKEQIEEMELRQRVSELERKLEELTHHEQKACEVIGEMARKIDSLETKLRQAKSASKKMVHAIDTLNNAEYKIAYRELKQVYK